MEVTAGKATRGASKAHWANKVFGEFTELPGNILPSKADIVRRYFYKKQEFHQRTLQRKLAPADRISLIVETTERVLEKWQRAGIPDFGQKKNAKEWQQLVVPLTPQRVEEMLNGSDLNLKDLTLASRVRVQVREEMRKTTLSKESRSIEISFPLPRDQRKRRLKEQILQAKKAKLDTMSLEDLEAEAKAEGLQAI